MSNLPTRKPNRLPDFDYSGVGSYFITICSASRKPIFWSNIVPSTVVSAPLTLIGQAIQRGIMQIGEIYPSVSVDVYCIMPDHVHILLSISESISKDRPDVSRIINQLKGRTAKYVGQKIWQKSYFDRVVRSEKEYLEIWKYIENNPICIDNGDFIPLFET